MPAVLVRRQMLPAVFSSALSEKTVKEDAQHNHREEHILPIALRIERENRKRDPANRCGDQS